MTSIRTLVPHKIKTLRYWGLGLQQIFLGNTIQPIKGIEILLQFWGYYYQQIFIVTKKFKGTTKYVFNQLKDLLWGPMTSPLCGRKEITRRMMLSVCLPSNCSCASQANLHYAVPHTSPRWVTHHPVLCRKRFHHPKKKKTLATTTTLLDCNAFP